MMRMRRRYGAFGEFGDARFERRRLGGNRGGAPDSRRRLRYGRG